MGQQAAVRADCKPGSIALASREGPHERVRQEVVGCQGLTHTADQACSAIWVESRAIDRIALEVKDFAPGLQFKDSYVLARFVCDPAPALVNRENRGKLRLDALQVLSEGPCR